MSDAQFVATATCFVADDFNINKFVESLADFALANQDSISDDVFCDLENTTKQDLIEEIADYVEASASVVIVRCNTQEINNNYSVMDWIIQILAKDYSAQPFVRVNSVWIDPRTAIEPEYWLIDKEGEPVLLDKIVSFYEKNRI